MKNVLFQGWSCVPLCPLCSLFSHFFQLCSTMTMCPTVPHSVPRCICPTVSTVIIVFHRVHCANCVSLFLMCHRINYVHCFSHCVYWCPTVSHCIPLCTLRPTVSSISTCTTFSNVSTVPNVFTVSTFSLRLLSSTVFIVFYYMYVYCALSILCLLRLLCLLFVQCAWPLCTTVAGAFYCYNYTVPNLSNCAYSAVSSKSNVSIVTHVVSTPLSHAFRLF